MKNVGSEDDLGGGEDGILVYLEFIMILCRNDFNYGFLRIFSVNDYIMTVLRAVEKLGF